MIKPTSSLGPRTRDTVGDALRELKECLPRKRFMHLAYRAEWVCKLIGVSPAKLPLDIPELRRKSLGKLVWAFCYVVENSPLVDRECSNRSGELSLKWRELLAKAQTAHARGSLSRLAYYCSRRQISPADVDAQTFAAFVAYWRSTRLMQSPSFHDRIMAHFWNELATCRPDLELKAL